MSKISEQLLISGQFQDICDISGQLRALTSFVRLSELLVPLLVRRIGCNIFSFVECCQSNSTPTNGPCHGNWL